MGSRIVLGNCQGQWSQPLHADSRLQEHHYITLAPVCPTTVSAVQEGLLGPWQSQSDYYGLFWSHHVPGSSPTAPVCGQARSVCCQSPPGGLEANWDLKALYLSP
jgi:hypothetical protein